MSNPISVFKFGIRCVPIHWRASAVGSIRGVLTADEMKQAAQTTHEAKKAAKFMAECIAALSLSVIDLIVTGKNLLKAKSKKSDAPNKTLVKQNDDVTIDDIIRDGRHLENDKLKPNIKYQTGEYNYVYQTNKDGLISHASTNNLQKILTMCFIQ